jgi:hypothetical protein
MMPSAQSQEEEPAANWIPLSHAIFFFTVEGWRDAEKSCRWIKLDYPQYRPAIDGTDHVVLNCHGFKFNISVLYARFAFERPSVEGQLAEHPSMFETTWAEFSGFERDALTIWQPFQDESLRRLWEVAHEIWRILRVNFCIGVNCGSGQVTARCGSPLASFSSLGADSWKYIKVIDWREGIAETPDGERLYSIHVAPHPQVGKEVEILFRG